MNDVVCGMFTLIANRHHYIILVFSNASRMNTSRYVATRCITGT